MKKISKGLSVFIIVFGLFLWCLAEENEQDPMDWNGDLALGISVSQGNTDKSSLSFSFSADKLFSEKLEWNNKGIFLGGKSEGKTDSQSAEVRSTLKWNHSDRFFTHYEMLILHDKFKDYRYRLTPNLGVGYRLVQSQKSELSVKTGFIETFTKFYDSGDTDSYAGLFARSDFKWKISESAEFTQLVNVNWDLSETSHFLARLESTLVTSIIAGWGIKLSLIDDYDSRPENPGVKKNDLTFLTNISLNF
jgi:putative salt-induced outer membrane protein YdiY